VGAQGTPGCDWSALKRTLSSLRRFSDAFLPYFRPCSTHGAHVHGSIWWGLQPYLSVLPVCRLARRRGGGGRGWARCGKVFRMQLQALRWSAAVGSACAQVVDVSIRFPGAINSYLCLCRNQFYNTSCVFNFLTLGVLAFVSGRHNRTVSSSIQGSITGSKLLCSAVITQLSPSSYRQSGPNQKS
jgi:hypothetical protein